MAKPKSIPEQPADSKKIGAEEKLELIFRNVEAIRMFYRKQKDSGAELGHNAMHELIFSNLSLAMELALSGKIWTEEELDKRS